MEIAEFNLNTKNDFINQKGEQYWDNNKKAFQVYK